MEPETVRLRVVFKDRNMLSKSLKSSGLKRSWILLKPQHQTISDLASDILHDFDLLNTCPNGIILSMDGYALPPFESTCLLKDKDIISVTKKRGVLDTICFGDGENSLQLEVVEKQPVSTGMKLLANEEFEKETGGYESEPEEDKDNQSEDVPQVEITPAKSKASKKRKASKELRSPKSKKSKHSTVEKHPIYENIGNDVLAKQNRNSFHDKALSKKNLAKKDKSCTVQGEEDELKASKINERSDDDSKSSASAKQSYGLEENGEKHVDACQTTVETKKVPSRSARRKKAKRQWLRMANQEKKELQERQILHQNDQQSPDTVNDIYPEKHQPDQNNDTSNKVVHIFPEKKQKSDQNHDAEECYVPVVIKPGHIRFKVLGEDDDVQQNNQVPAETFQWNGITSKKKGQKWGMEKISSNRRNDYRNPSVESSESSEMLTIEEGLPANGPLDFDKLTPYTSLPKEGDVIAYRLIELSSGWTPELTSFRVGKISQYDPRSNNIVLVPVPEYPIVFEKEVDEEASELLPDNSLYADDGTLEINFVSLVDIRSVKQGNSNSTHSVSGRVNGARVEVRDAPSDNKTNTNSDKTHVPTQENGDAWEEISRALNAKKAQLSHEDDSSKKDNAGGRSSSSYKGVRRGALGPMMNLLRAQNKL